MPLKVLIVEDDQHILMGLEEVLRGEGFDVASCARGDLAVETVAKQKPALILLDVMLPGLSGYDVCKQLRAKKISTPVLMLTAKSLEIDKVVGLEVGADDYVTKPFGVRELLARIHALLRRSRSAGNSDHGSEAPFVIGQATIDPRTFQLTRGDSVEQLSAREMKLLQIFVACPGQVLSREKLLTQAWGYSYYGTTRTLDQMIVRLRRKLGDNAEQPRHIVTVHGIGYKLAP